MPTRKKPVVKKTPGETLYHSKPPPFKPSSQRKIESRTLTQMTESVTRTKHAVLATMTQLVTAAFGLVAALAWNDAIQSLVKQYFEAGDDIPAKIWYSVIVTLIAVIVTLWLGKLKER